MPCIFPPSLLRLHPRPHLRMHGGRAVNRGELKHANQGCALLVACLSFSTSIVILIREGILPFVAFFPLAAGFMYSRGATIAGLSLKLKRGLGIKNLIVAFTWASTIIAFVYPWTMSYRMLSLIFAFFFLKSFINTVIYDCRDARGDALAGLITIPVYFGERKTRVILGVLHTSFHLGIAASVLLGFIEFRPIILLYSGGMGFLYIWLYTNNRKAFFRDILVDGEWIIAVLFRNIYQFSRSAFYSS